MGYMLNILCLFFGSAFSIQMQALFIHWQYYFCCDDNVCCHLRDSFCCCCWCVLHSFVLLYCRLLFFFWFFFIKIIKLNLLSFQWDVYEFKSATRLCNNTSEQMTAQRTNGRMNEWTNERTNAKTEIAKQGWACDWEWDANSANQQPNDIHKHTHC